jgi:O-antigen ligase
MLALAMGLAAVGTYQSLQDFQCIVLEPDENGSLEDASKGTPNGMECNDSRECAKQAHDFKTDFLCEKPGLFSTFSIGHGRVRYRGILADPNELSLAIGAGLSFAFALHASSKRKLRHILLAAATGLATYCVIQTQSRGGVLVLLAIFGTYFVRRYGAKGFLLAAVFGAPALLLGGRSGEEADSSALERIGALYQGMDFVKEHPFMGLGVAQFTENYFITAHNSYVLSAAELGFPGMVIWTSLVYVSIKIAYLVGTRSTQGLDPQLVPFAFALMTSFAGICIGIFFLSFCYQPILYIYFGMSGALYLAAKRSAPTFEVKVSRKELVYITGFDGILLCIIFVYTRIKGSP